MEFNSLTEDRKKKVLGTFYDMKYLLPRYIQLRNDEDELHRFCVRSRNYLWDISSWEVFNFKFFSKGTTGKKVVKDHLIQRTKATKIIFELMYLNQDMTIYDFYNLLLIYNGVVILSKEQHSLITSYTKKKENKDIYNFQVYKILGIKFDEEFNKIIEHYNSTIPAYSNVVGFWG